jgi:lipoic acid synthetase
MDKWPAKFKPGLLMPKTDPKPNWLRIKIPAHTDIREAIAQVKNHSLCTVCVEAQCPNQLECFSRGTATFMLLGPYCTRDCTFCAVQKTRINRPDPNEPEKIAIALDQMDISYCVLTMVARDDLQDGGARHIIETIKAIRKLENEIKVELLVSDFNGNWDALKSVLDTKPAVLNHNVETVPHLYPSVRPQADYKRSIELLSRASVHVSDVVTKSGLMLGLGEGKAEVIQTMRDFGQAGCQLITLGQYLAPSTHHHPVVRYVTPEEFSEFELEAYRLGFVGVASSPLVRSSYHADFLYESAILNKNPSK